MCSLNTRCDSRRLTTPAFVEEYTAQGILDGLIHITVSKDYQRRFTTELWEQQKNKDDLIRMRIIKIKLLARFYVRVMYV